MAKHEITYEMTLKAKTDELIQQLDSVKKHLNTALESGANPKLAKYLEDLENRLMAFITKTNAPVHSKNIFTQLEKESINLSTMMTNVDKQIKAIGKLDLKDKIKFTSKEDQTRLGKIIDLIKKTNDLKTNSKTLEDQIKDDTNTQKDLITKQNKALKEQQEYYKQIEDIKKRQVHFKETEELYDKEGWDKTKSYKKDGKTYNLAKEQANTPTKEALSQIQAQYKTVGAEVESYAGKIGRLSSAIKSNQEALSNFKKALQEIKTASKETGISLEHIGTNVTDENIQKIIDRLTELLEKGLEPLEKELNEASNAQENFNNTLKNTNETINEQKQDFIEQDEAAGEVQGIVSRIKQFTGLAGAALMARRALHNAITTIKELDKQMTEMAVVTDLNVGDYWKQLPEHTERANALGMAIKDVYEAETLYYQQGLKTAQVTELSTSTLKMARIAGLSAEDATNKMTAALRGFNMEINETNADRIADVYSKLAAITASNVQEISTAMTKTASLAANAGMQFETTAAFLSQIIETTRESAETAGTALKTVIARFQELKKAPEDIGEVDGEIIDANKIETALRTVGVALRDTQGQFRNLDEVFLELASRWDSLDTNTQRYIATIAAGSRQQSRFIAMMSNYRRTMTLVNAANNAAGASNEQFEKTLESLESKLAALKNAWDTFTLGLVNNEFVKTGIDFLTKLLDAINNLTEGWDAWSSSILKLGLAIAGLSVASKILKVFEAHFTKAKSSMGIFTSATEAAKGTVQDFFKWIGGIGERIKNYGSKLRETVLKINDFTIAHTPLKEMLRQVTAAQQAYINKVRESNGIEAINSAEKSALVFQLHGYFTALGLTNDEAQNAIDIAFLGINADQAAILAKKGLTAEIIKEKLAVDALNGSLNDEQLKTLEVSLTDGTSTGLKKITKILGQSKEEWGKWFTNLKTGFKDLGGAIGKFFSNFGASIGYFAAAAAVLAITIVGIIHIVKAFHRNSPEGKLEAATEQMEALSRAAEEVNTNFKNLSDKFDSFTEASDKIKDLTQGTREWRNAIAEVNQQYFDLIETYPELAKLQTTTENGYIEFVDKLAANKIMDQAQANVLAVQNAATVAKLAVLQRQQDVDFANLSNAAKVGSTSGAGWGAWGAITGTAFTGGISAGALAGAGVGSLAGGVTAAPGAVIGAAIGGAAGLIGGTITAFATGAIEDAKKTAEMEQKALTDKFAVHLTKTQNMTESEIASWLQKNSDIYKNNEVEARRVAAELVTVQNELRHYGQSLHQADVQTQAYITTIQSNIMNTINANAYTATELQQMTELLTKELIDSFEKDASDVIEKAAENKQLNNLNTELGQEYYNYFKSQYGESVQISKKGKVTYKDDEGKTQTLSEEVAWEAFKSGKALKELTKAAEQLPKALKRLDTGIKNSANNLFKNSEGLNLTQKDIEELTPEKLKDIWDASSEELKAIYKTYENYETEMNKRITGGATALKEVEEMLESIQLNDFSFDTQLTAGAKKGLTQHLVSIVTAMGPEVGKELGNLINETLSKVDIDERETFVASLNAITDWTDAGALDGLITQLQNVTDSLPTAEIKAFVEEMKDTSKAIYSVKLDSLIDSCYKLNEIIADIKKNVQDRFFSEDRYKEIIEKLPEYESQFQLSGDQRYFTGDINQLLNDIENLESDQVRDTISTAVAQEGARETLGKIDTTEIEEDYQERVKNSLDNRLKDIEQYTTIFDWLFDDRNQIVSQQALETFSNALRNPFITNHINSMLTNSLQVSPDNVDQRYISQVEKVMLRQMLREEGINSSDYYNTKQQIENTTIPNLILSNYEAWDAQAKKEWIQQAVKQLEEDRVDIQYLGLGNVSNLDKISDNDDELNKILEKLLTITNETLTDDQRNKLLSAAFADLANKIGYEIRNVGKDNTDNTWEIDFEASNIKLKESGLLSGMTEEDFKEMDKLIEDYKTAKENGEDYTKILRQLQTVRNKLAERQDYLVMYNNLQTNIDKFKELSEAYKETSNTIKKESLAQTIASTFKINLDETNYESFMENIDLFLQGNRKGLVEILKLAAEVKGVTDEQFNELLPAEGLAISKMSEEQKAFMNTMIYLGYGFVDAADNFHLAITEAIDIAKDTMDEIKKWQSPYDWLYNANQRINALARQRNIYEQDYQRMIEEDKNSYVDIQKNLESQIDLVSKEAEANKHLYDGAKASLEEYIKRIESTPELSKLQGAIAVGPAGQITIDKEKLYNINVTEDEGGIYEEIIGEIEEQVDTMNDAVDNLNDNVDTIRKLRDTGKDAYKDLLDRVKQALIQVRQKEIDKLSKINDSINNAQSVLLDKMQEQIDEQRQARDNQKIEQNIIDKQTRLAYLRASGGNTTEILKLQKEITNDQEAYQNNLVDQTLNATQKANEKAADQRQTQIDIAQAQLDYWSEYEAEHSAEQMLNQSITAIQNGTEPIKTAMGDLLTEADNTAAMAEINKIDWENNFGTSGKLASIYSVLTNSDIGIGREVKDASDAITKAYEAIETDFVALSTGNTALFNKIEQLTWPSTTEWNATVQGWLSSLAEILGTSAPQVDESTLINQFVTDAISRGLNTNTWDQSRAGQKKWGDLFDIFNNLSESGKDEAWRRLEEAQLPSIYGANADQNTRHAREIQNLLHQERMQPGDRDMAKYTLSDGTNAMKAWTSLPDDWKQKIWSQKAFATGGLADFTGPAWMDGTPSAPELVLNATDTANFIALKDILSEIMRGSHERAADQSSTNGNNYYDIRVEVDSIDSDYGVDQAADRIKELIEEDAMYRNVTAVNKTR